MLKKYKRLIIVMLMSIIFTLPSTAVFAENSAVVKDEQGVVRILVEDKNGVFTQTTGFAVGKKPVKYFVTSGKSLENYKNIKIIIDKIGNSSSVDATVIKINRNPDYALLSTAAEVNIWKPLKLSSSKNVKKSNKVYLLGFSETKEKIDMKSQDDMFPSSPQDVKIEQTSVSKSKTEIANVLYIQTEAEGKYGFYGGPLVDEKGNVIGINAYSPDGQDKSNVAIHVDYLTTFLDNNKIPYEKPSSVLVFLIPLVLVLVIIAIILLIKNQKKSKTVPAYMDNESKTVALNEQPPAGARASSSSSSNYPHVVGVSGYFMSKEFKIADRVVVGRDPRRTEITFPDKTKGVSAVHMEIRNVSGRIEIVDLGSTYGTFLANGTKLKPTIPYIVNKSESFYLGDRENKFQVL